MPEVPPVSGSSRLIDKAARLSDKAARLRDRVAASFSESGALARVVDGYEPRDGSPVPGSVMREGHTYSLIAQALDIDFRGRTEMSGLIR